jgi:hypothetical protein
MKLFLMTLIFAGGGLVCAVIGLRLLYKALRLMLKGVKATGKVMEVSVEAALDGDFFQPTISFKTQGGEKIVATYRSQHNLNAHWEVGAPVQLCYDPLRPQEILVGTLWVHLLVRIFMVIVGVFLASQPYVWSWFSQP